MSTPSDDWLDDILQQAKVAHEQEREPVVAELLGPYLQCRPEDDYGWFLFGDSLRVLGLTDEAERALLKSVDLADGPDWVLQITLAHLYKDAGNCVEAEKWFELAAEDEAAASASWFWVLRSSNLAAHGQFVAAEKVVRNAVELADDDRDEALLNLGNILRAQGRYREARLHYNAALDINPGYTLAEKGLHSLEGVDEARRLARQISSDS